jgi:hypothetical protein
MIPCAALLIAFLSASQAVAAPDKPGVMLGAFIPSTEHYTETILSFDQATGKRHTHSMMFIEFDYNFDEYPFLLEQVKAAGKIPIVTWQPGYDGISHQDFSYDSFLAGAHDAVILRVARQLKSHGDPVYLRFAHEMNLSCAPMWPGHAWNRNDAEGFNRMWRYVHGKFDEVGADNVLWVWSPAYMGAAEGLDTFSDYVNLYPGDDWVDMVGTSGLNFGDNSPAGPGFCVTAQWLFIPILRDLMGGSVSSRGTAPLRALAELSRGKPQGIFETGGVAGPSDGRGGIWSRIPKEDWIRQGYDAIAHMNEFNFVRLIVWYNDIAMSGYAPHDFRVAQNPGRANEVGLPVPPSVTQAYRDAISDPAFLSTLLPPEELNPGDHYRAPSMLDPTDYSQHEFWLSVRPDGTLRKGATVAAAYFTKPPINPNPLNWNNDAYVVAQLPNGSFYAFIPPNRWVHFSPNSGPPPVTVKNFSVKRNGRGMAFVQPLAASLPAGIYTVYSALVPPGADPRQPGIPDLRIARFTLAD